MTEKNKRYYIVTIFLFVLHFSVSAQTSDVILQGEAEDYKNTELTFYTFSDLITKQEEPLAKTKVDKEGKFTCRLPIEDTMQVFLNMGIYKAYLFVTPGNEYNIKLPPRKDKSKEQKMNPYFQNRSYHIRIENGEKNILNTQIYRFLRTYNRIINQNIELIYNSPHVLDSLANLIDTTHNYNSPYFNQFKKYKLGDLRITSTNNEPSNILEALFAEQDIPYRNTAYMDLFNQTFENYFEEFYSKYDRSIDRIVNQAGKLANLDSVLQKADLLKDHPQLRKLVMLKGLHDAYYGNNYKKSSIVKLLDRFQEFSEDDYHKKIAKNIHDKVTRIRVGFEAPDFCLYDLDSNLVCLDSLQGNYIYLGFCNTDNYTCLRQFKLLNNLYERHKNHFKIIIIATDENLEKLKRHVERNKYKWTILHYGNEPEILKKYNVRTIPSYFFIVPDGTLSLSPAPTPTEKVEQKIFKEMRKRGDI